MEGFLDRGAVPGFADEKDGVPENEVESFSGALSVWMRNSQSHHFLQIPKPDDIFLDKWTT